MEKFQIVPDYLRNDKTTRGRIPKSNLSKALLNGSTIFISGERKTWGSLYTLAKNHDKICRTERRTLHKNNGESEEGTIIWFEDRKEKK